MKTLTVRFPETLVAEIEAESQRRRLSKSDVVRERLTAGEKSRDDQPPLLEAIADVIGSVDQLPKDLSARTKKHLKSTGYADKALVDTCFLVALPIRRDDNHLWAAAQAPRSPPPWRTCKAVLPETSRAP